MKHGSLFSGIGGFDLAAQWMGWENVFHCEWNSFGQKVLKHYWPNAISYEDITKTDFTVHRGNIDILTGGFPCQPYSMAGKRLGKEDERHLWPEMLRAIREIKPRWVVGENVLGLVNWSGGLVFHEVQADLEAEGYEVFPYVLPAASVGAPHRRDRVWFVAYCNGAGLQTSRTEQQATRVEQHGKMVGVLTDTNSNGLNECNGTDEVNASEGRQYAQRDTKQGIDDGDAADSIGFGIGKSREGRQSEQFNEDGITGRIITNTEITRQQTRINGSRQKQFGRRNSGMGLSNYWESFPTVSPVCFGDDGLSDRLDGITFSKWRNESIKAGGNAIVPQVAYQIFKTIEQYEFIQLQGNGDQSH